MQSELRQSKQWISKVLLLISISTSAFIPWTLAQGDTADLAAAKQAEVDDYAGCIDVIYYFCSSNCTGAGTWAVTICDAVPYMMLCKDTVDIRDCGETEEEGHDCGGYSGCNT